MFYIFRPLRLEVWLTLIGTGVVVLLATLFSSIVLDGFTMVWDTFAHDVMYIIGTVLSQRK